MPEACSAGPRGKRNPARHNQAAASQRHATNWKVADIIPQPSLAVSGKIRDRLAPLTGIYALEDEGE
jgi:hypothetical protein